MSKNTSKPVSTKSNNLIDAGFFKKLNGMEIRIVNLAISKLNPTRSLSQIEDLNFLYKIFWIV
ncbi:hypothetical protein ACOARS_12155, partial [Glaesserella parasuis]|uniref:hypothetical protein n=1 Tax=Glaesserella parasuis TaxID=738 RepID=UPI003B7F22EC